MSFITIRENEILANISTLTVFTSLLCLDECDLNPGACLYGGTCINGTNKYTCSCPTGFSGDNCEITPDYCSSKDCLGNPCYNSLDDSSGVCHCQPDFYGSTGMYIQTYGSADEALVHIGYASINPLLHNTVKTCLKKRIKFVFKVDYRLMQVKSIAECSNGSIL